MQLQHNIYKLQGKVQHYAWGGSQFIPTLLHINNEENKPCAEYWMGAHPSASSILETEQGPVALFDVIQSNPTYYLTQPVYDKFGELPYLFKILDVKDMLSIQVHPTKIEAEKGFLAEEAAGIPINAPHRNYKDKNHKPEVMVALSDEFWLLHGFKTATELEKTLNEIAEFHVLLPLFKQQGYKGLYQFVMEMPQQDADAMLLPLVKKELLKKELNQLDRSMPGWWVCKLFENNANFSQLDKGIFSIYFFNIVKATKGEAVFQGAGIPHAYLEGQNAELMANSDNVLRGGLTPKHVDVPELLKHTLFEGIQPHILKGNVVNTEKTELAYPCPVPDFAISQINLHQQTFSSSSTSIEIFIVTQGAVVVNGSNNLNLKLKQGECFAVFPNEQFTVAATGHAVLFKAAVAQL